MDNNCGICLAPAEQLFETDKDGVFACLKCSPLVPEVTMEDTQNDNSSTIEVEIEGTEGTAKFCDLCDKYFKTNHQYQNHMRNHRADKRYICTYCNKGFSQSNNLRAHLRIHTNERPYKCSECGKAFTQVTNLNNHVRLHTGERPFVCPEPGCGKAYAQVTNLNQHKKRHLNGRPVSMTYDCNVCGEQFEQRNHMFLHRKQEHTDLKNPVKQASKPSHVCKICDQVFPSERQLVRHVGEHMAINNTEDPIATSDGESEPTPVSKCPFDSCGRLFASKAQYSIHLLRAHQIRVTPAGAPASPPASQPIVQPSKRGRPAKAVKFETEFVEIKSDAVFDMEIKPAKEESHFFPKLRIHNLFK